MSGPFKMKDSPAKQLFPFGKRKGKIEKFERGVGGEKIVSKKYSSGSSKKRKKVEYGEYGQILSKTVTKYTKSGDIKKQRSRKTNQKRWQ